MSQKILIVDDSKVSRMFICSYLSELQPDWQLFEADGGEQALALAAEHQFYAATLDFNMVGMNGLELAAALKEVQSDCFIGLLTANIQRFTQDDALQANINYYKKPISMDLMGKIVDDIGAFYGSV